MLKKLKSIALTARLMPHMIVVTTRVATGRLYTCRDRPDWVVHALAGMVCTRDDTDVTARVIRDARTEQRLRLYRLVAKLEELGNCDFQLALHAAGLRDVFNEWDKR